MQEMAEVLGCHPSTVHKYIQRYGIERHEPWKDESWLREMWIERGMTTYEMAEDLPVCASTIQRQIDKRNIERPYQNAEKLKELYIQKEMSCPEIAERFHCSETTVGYWLEKHGIETRSQKEATIIAQRQNDVWFGMANNGYERIDSQYRHEQHSVLHHRLLATLKFDLDELRDKIVHHKNGVKWDNRLENLELMSRAEHARHHKPRLKSE